MTEGKTLKLGLIGDNIARSRSPLLHRLAGDQNGIAVTYERLVPKDMGESFEQVFDRCRTGGYRGINVTYPYKERVTAQLRVDDPLVRAMGACNTVIFEADGPRGFNTDYSGFVAAYETVRGKMATGPVLMIGTGGVGRAVAFGLARLGCTELRLVDRDPAKAEALADALHSVVPDMDISIWIDAENAAQGASGLINCTPVGMVGYDGTPLRAGAIFGSDWAFDAVYTPTDTQFLTDAAAAGLSIISGWELFFFQGVHAWTLFSGLGLDQAALRARLLADDAAA
ncbi:shikimate dehydrogenase family protein [Maliponia aquimaris]|uniref:Quinate/shikimate dehydrogenase n=1 Tax=Maliponia aquimaris TaxID=1673631 RepID=A0A238L139_9RHOB|nr:shikimate dehydrogenase [Maliponia aquimaris]SMX48580.1 Quinate/shikimate dehydrogenase [Maliponia aquimaris]